MGMQERAGCQNGPVRSHDMPFVCVMIPTGIPVRQGGIEAKCTIRSFRNLHLDHISFTGKGSTGGDETEQDCR